MRHAAASLLVAAFALAGCQTPTSGAGTVGPLLPVMPGALAAPCPPLAQAALEDDVRAIAIDDGVAYDRCASRHDAAVKFYSDLRKELAK